MGQHSVQFFSAVLSCQNLTSSSPSSFLRQKSLKLVKGRELCSRQSVNKRVSKLFYSLSDCALICCITLKIRWLDLPLPLLLELYETEVINTCLRECLTLILNGLTFVKLFESLRCGSVWKFKALLSCGINRCFSRPILLYVKDNKL